MIRIGTRKSKLAMWQAYYVEDRLLKAGLQTEIVPIETRGDKILSVSIAGIGSKGVFTEELEQMLLDGAIDIAVHSAKDLPSALPEYFEIAAFTEREEVYDVLIGVRPEISLSRDDNNLLIGTSSTRRIAMLKHFYPGVRTVDVRGNLQTRISKMKSGLCDALLLAYAGVKRMDFTHLIRQKLDPMAFTPAAGQGSLAVEISRKLDTAKKQLVRRILNHPETEMCLRAERAFLSAMEGGCSIPVFALARLQVKKLHITGGVLSLDGGHMVRKILESANGNPEREGRQLAERVLNAGGKEILMEINDLLS